ncbi:hypothetical protein HZQ75_06220 [Elizabethkingia anophelis]|uniref:Uncharacterized protein n=1 Tax=Elizabethkingia anophelis R26 TaxID=1246994 RepID=A0ABN5C1C0_9FLAO|nr:hypothetical protein [Elizabethkingia anophelis]ATC37632.1 hypothetical protein BAZ09_015915 [Elizabethkingia anophelis R26]ATC41311.1 hypothetical protein EAAG1_016130 [Elizabethkingia anophelis Ag1]ATC44988.1 hypothetical protein CMV41_16130 [Elizabethkingia anophelis]ATC48664.1 hypothetical protein CMV40_16130 [Elizabethkingia anophelis]ELR81141.1 hypothetical protein D505_00740 [Elizabethkingia anophelis R26]
METFNTYFTKLRNKDINFVDIPLGEDLEAFICPFLIENKKLSAPIALKVYERVHQFLIKLNRDFIEPDKRNEGIEFLSHLHEPNEFHLGYSHRNKGKAVSDVRAEVIYDALRNNTLAKQNAAITNEAHFVLLLVKGIGQDIMSDIIANVCRDIFSDFTLQICRKHNIYTIAKSIEFYNSIKGFWEVTKVELPDYAGKPIILLPKFIISGGRAYANLYNWFIAKNYISLEILNRKKTLPTDGQFIFKLKDGTQKAIIKKIYKAYRKPKDELIDFVKKFRGSLDEFVWYARENYPELNLDDLR